MCLFKIVKTEYVEKQDQAVDKPFKACTLKGKELKVKQVLGQQPRIEVKYYLFGIILVCKIVFMKRKQEFKTTYEILD